MEGDVRLLEGATKREGRVEFCKDNAWGTVCDYGWGTMDAMVVCRQMGYSAIDKLHDIVFCAYRYHHLVLYYCYRNYLQNIILLWWRYWSNSIELSSMHWN